MGRLNSVLRCAAMGALMFGIAQTCSAQGFIVSANGPVHRGMGGASTAAPTSAISALYWNPATISGLAHSELEFGSDVLFVDHTVESSYGPFAGKTDAEPGTLVLPSVGWVHHLESHPSITFGLGISSIAGFKTNFPTDLSNPVLMPQPNGLGTVSSEATFANITPVISYAVSNSLSLAVGPVITTGQVGIQPFIFDSANANLTYPSGRSTKYEWGGGVQAGVYYIHSECLHLGASIKSPSWMSDFEYYASDENGLPRMMTADVDLPMIISLGTAFTGCENWLFAMDARYIDYANTDGLGDPTVFNQTGALAGLGWSSVWGIAMGAQRQIGEKCHLRLGYSFNQSPIRDSESFFNTASSLFYKHTLSVGGSYEVNERLAISMAYSHYFNNSVTGPIVSPQFGPLPGSSVTNDVTANFLSFGVLMRL